MNVWEKFNATFICMIMIISLQGPFFPPLFTNGRICVKLCLCTKTSVREFAYETFGGLFEVRQ